MRPTYSTAADPRCASSGRSAGFGPFGFARLPRPFPFRMTSVPSERVETPVGYHPVGTKPITRDRADPISATAIALPSEHTVYSRLPVVYTAKAEGVMPRGCNGVIDTL